MWGVCGGWRCVRVPPPSPLPLCTACVVQGAACAIVCVLLCSSARGVGDGEEESPRRVSAGGGGGVGALAGAMLLLLPGTPMSPVPPPHTVHGTLVAPLPFFPHPSARVSVAWHVLFVAWYVEGT
jgi:hypothetical protein